MFIKNSPVVEPFQLLKNWLFLIEALNWAESSETNVNIYYTFYLYEAISSYFKTEFLTTILTAYCIFSVAFKCPKTTNHKPSFWYNLFWLVVFWALKGHLIFRLLFKILQSRNDTRPWTIMPICFFFIFAFAFIPLLSTHKHKKIWKIWEIVSYLPFTRF